MDQLRRQCDSGKKRCTLLVFTISRSTRQCSAPRSAQTAFASGWRTVHLHQLSSAWRDANKGNCRLAMQSVPRHILELIGQPNAQLLPISPRGHVWQLVTGDCTAVLRSSADSLDSVTWLHSFLD